MTSARHFRMLLNIILAALTAAVATALVSNRLELAAISLGVVLIAGCSWCAAHLRGRRTRPSFQAGTCALVALGSVLAAAGTADFLDVSLWGRGTDVALGAGLAAVLSAAMVARFAAAVFPAGPRVGLGLAAGWALFAPVTVMSATESGSIPP